MSRITTSIYTPVHEPEPDAFEVLRSLAPEEVAEIVDTVSSMSGFRKLAATHDLVFHLQGTEVRVAATRYASKGDGHNIGDLKDPEFVQRVVTLSLTNVDDFFAQATWYERFPKFRDGRPKPPEFVLESGRSGRTGHAPSHPTAKITALTKEINECLT